MVDTCEVILHEFDQALEPNPYPVLHLEINDLYSRLFEYANPDKRKAVILGNKAR